MEFSLNAGEMSKQTTDDFFDTWKETTPPPKTEVKSNPPKSILKRETTPAGRTGGRGTPAGGRGGHLARGVGPGDVIPDPWAGDNLEKPVFDERTEELVRNLLQRPDDSIITEEDTAELAPRVAMQVLMILFADRGKSHYKSGTRTQLAHRIRYKSEEWVRDLLNDPEKLIQEVTVMDITPSSTSVLGAYSAPLEFIDLIGVKAKVALARAETPQDKRDAILRILQIYFTRNFERDEALKALYQELSGFSVEHLQHIIKNKGMLTKHIYKKGKAGP